MESAVRRPAGRIAGVVIVGALVVTTSLAVAGSGAAAGQDTTTTTATTSSSSSSTGSTTTAAPTTTTTEGSSTTGSESSTSTSEATTTTLSAEQRRERDRAVANLSLARANDREIAVQLRQITEQANATVEKVEEAKRRLEQAQLLAGRSASALEESGSKQAEIEASLAIQAIEGYKTRSLGQMDLLLSDVSVNEAIRQNQLLSEANTSTADLLEELRGLLEDRRLANAEAEQAATAARQAQIELQAQLDKLKEQQTAQIGLKAEAERRIDAWAGELTAYAKEDAAIQSLIGREAAPINVGVAAPTNPSALGFQWPINAPMTSPYGYRVHPVYGTRRLHAGIDLGAPRGTPIAASNDGTVIFAGVQGGYGNTVILDHGAGITTLYAHLTSFGVAQGAVVSRGDIVGYVGRTGTATGNHLHFEVRVNGGPVNPVNYLP